jgi:hypothetical protein
VREVRRCREEILASKADLLHLCEEWPDEHFCEERDDGECFNYRCSDCNEAIAGSDSYLEYQASIPSLDEQHAAAWLQKGGR